MERDTIKKDYYVYCHVTPSGKKYIGISKDPVKRWNGGKGYINNYHFYRAIVKYGWDNIQHIILKTGLTIEEAKQTEIELIAEHHTTDRAHGYNLRDGGDGSFSEHSLKLMSESRKGNNNCVGRDLNSETRQKIAKSLKKYYESHDGTFKGKKHSPQTIEKLKNRFVSAETLAKMSKGHADVSGRKNPAARAVIKYSMDGKALCRYDYIAQAAIENGCDASSISKCCRGKIKYCGGYIWKYAG